MAQAENHSIRINSLIYSESYSNPSVTGINSHVRGGNPTSALRALMFCYLGTRMFNGKVTTLTWDYSLHSTSILGGVSFRLNIALLETMPSNGGVCLQTLNREKLIVWSACIRLLPVLRLHYS